MAGAALSFSRIRFIASGSGETCLINSTRHFVFDRMSQGLVSVVGKTAVTSRFAVAVSTRVPGFNSDRVARSVIGHGEHLYGGS